MSDALEAEQPQDGKLDEYEAQLKDAEETQEHNIQMLEDAKTEKNKLVEKNSNLKDSIEEIQGRIEQIELQARKLEARAEKLEQIRRRALQHKNTALEAVDELRQQRESFERERREQEETVQEYTQQAGEVCDRVEISEGETSESLETKFNRLQKDLDEQERV